MKSKSLIMRRAWSLRRESAARLNCAPSAIPMGPCLKMAWAEAKAVAAPRENREAEKARQDFFEASRVRLKEEKFKAKFRAALPTKERPIFREGDTTLGGVECVYVRKFFIKE